MARRVAARAARRHEQRLRTRCDRVARDLAAPREVAQRHVARGEQAPVRGAEVEHRPVVSAREAVRVVHIVGALGHQQGLVHERVEHELALEAEQVERARAVLLQERAGRRPVLADHELRRVVRAVGGIGVLGAEPREQPLVLARCERRHEALRQARAHGRLRTRAQHLRGLHHVRVGVVHASVGIRHARQSTAAAAWGGKRVHEPGEMRFCAPAGVSWTPWPCATSSHG